MFTKSKSVFIELLKILNKKTFLNIINFILQQTSKKSLSALQVLHIKKKNLFIFKIFLRQHAFNRKCECLFPVPHACLPICFCRKQKRKQTQLKGSFMKINSTRIYEKLFLIVAPAYEWKLILNFEAIMFCLLKVRHALHALHSWTLRPCTCLRSTVTCRKTPTAVNFEPLLPCYCYALKASFKTILPQVSQPAFAGNVADLVNSKLISHHCMMPEQWIRLLCRVSVILANETVIARIKSIKLLTSGVLEIFGS